mgnify:CR=1 FL=1
MPSVSVSVLPRSPPMANAAPALATLRDAAEITDDEKKLLQFFQLLSAKPVLYVCNVDEADAATGNALSQRVAEKAKAEGAMSVVISAAIEAEIARHEESVSALSAQLEDPALYTKPGGVEESVKIGKELEAAKVKLDDVMAQWTELVEKKERMG